MDFRTDLAIEIKESLPQKASDGITTAAFEKNGVKVTKIKITNSQGEQAIGKPIGTYITAEIPNLSKYSCADEGIMSTLGSLLGELLPESGTVLTVGLGNKNITPDALGPLSCSMILATRHISGELARSVGLDSLRPSAVHSPGVLGQTGVESAEIIKGVVRQINPAAVIVIDALAARRLSRLGCTVQMSDTGIIPGSGVGNSRSEISKATLGVPVISIGVPTVVDAGTLVHGLVGEAAPLKKENSSMIITPREIDLVIDRAARLVGMAVNKALQRDISTEEILMLL